jgi:methyl-accepting chemotaxis protein
MRSPAPTPLSWFADRRLAVKFGLLAAVTALAFCAIVGVVRTGASSVHQNDALLADLTHAQVLVLELDTRASELKVDGLKVLVRANPADQLPELADDIATPQAMLDELATVPLTGDSAAAVADVMSTYGTYMDSVSAFVNGAVADQAGARARWEDVQAANDITDGAIDTAKDVILTARLSAIDDFNGSLDRMETMTYTVIGVGVLVVGLLLTATSRSISGPLARVRAALAAMATGDLTVGAEVDSRDEVGQMAAALTTAQEHLRTVIASVAASSDAVAAASEELSASSAQISSSAEETSAQSGVVSAAAEEVSRNDDHEVGDLVEGDRCGGEGDHQHRGADEPVGAQRHDRGRAGR